MPQAIPMIVYAAAAYIGASQVIVAVAVMIASAVVANYEKRKAERAARNAFNASLEDRLVMTATSNAKRSRIYGRARNTDGIVFKGTWGDKSQYYTLVVAMAGHEIEEFETIYFNDVALDLVSDGSPVGGGAGNGYWVTNPQFVSTEYIPSYADMTVTGGVGSVVLPATPVAGSVSAAILSGDSYLETPVTVVGNTVSVSGAPVDGVWQVAYQGENRPTFAHIWKYKGTETQDLSILLETRFPSLIEPTDNFKGIACVVVELLFSQDIWPLGVPSVTAVMRGAKVTDPRTGTTAWTENPAVIAYDWSRYSRGGGASASEVDTDSFIDAANACDVSTVFQLAGGGTETRPLYQCGLVIPLDANPADALGEIVLSMAGKSAWSSGQLSVVAGAYRAPVADIDDTWLADSEEIVIVKDASQADAVNVYRPVISNADGYVNGATGPRTSVAYTSTPAPEVRSSTYIAADGRELVRELTLAGVTRTVHAQHICGVLMRDARDGLTVRIPCNNKAFALQVFDVVTLTLSHFGFTAKQFEVLGWSYQFGEPIMLTLKETAAAIFDPASGLEVLDLADNTSLPKPWEVAQITGVTVDSSDVSIQDGWPVSRTVVSWTASADESVRQAGRIEVAYVAADQLAADAWQSTFADGSATEITIPGLRVGVAYYFMLRAINTLGVRGPWSVLASNIISDPALVDTGIIAPTAATEIYVQTPSSPVSITAVMHEPDGFGFNTTMASITFTPSGNGEAQAFFEGRCAFVAVSASPPNTNLQWSIQKSGAYDGWNVMYRTIPNGTTEYLTVAASRSFPVTAGVTYTLLACAAKLRSGDAPTVDNIQFRIEVVKR